MSLECWQEIIDDYERLLENDEEYDVIIYVGENENVKELHAHSNILRIRSQYFRTALSNEWAKKKDGKFILKKPNISPYLFKIILRFIYCGKIDLTKLGGPELLKLSISVDELNIQSLIPRIEEYLIKHQYKFLQQDPVGILETIYQNESFESLWDFCLEKICEKPEVLFDSDKFIGLKASIMELLLKRDDLGLQEIVIWGSLVKWALAQNSTIPKDFNKWSKEEITIMERTLHRYIPLIRFYCISSEDFLDKVYPLKEVLPKDLINSLLTFYLAPNRRLSSDKQPPRRSKLLKYDKSLIIEYQHFALFSNWINKQNDLYYNSRNIPYEFKLIFRGSRDGFDPVSFHNKCDNKGANIVIIKIKDSNQIIGGYNPLDWGGNDYIKHTPDSFIFSFRDYKNIKTGKIGRVIDTQNAIIRNQLYGPLFGYDSSCDISDIMLNPDGIWYSKTSSYPDMNIPGNTFKIDDYEVFQVTKEDY